MAITDKEQGVWGLDQVYNKINQGSIWEYSGEKQLWTAGYNGYGILGDNNTVTRSSPVQVPGTWDGAFSVGSQIAMATKSDGTLWVWGRNTSGELGTNEGTNSHKSSPVQIPGSTWPITGDYKMSNGGSMSSAIKTDGTLWTWGGNYRGGLGINVGGNPGPDRSSPVQVPGTTWSRVSTGTFAQLATKTDGTMWSWGSNVYGNLGLNQTSGAFPDYDVGQMYSSPVQIPGTTWSKIPQNVKSSRWAIKTDGTLWAWGANTYGQLGLNEQGGYPGFSGVHSSPTQIPGTTWDELYTGRGGTEIYVTKTDGTLWAWGRNNEGQLGQNNTTLYSSPVQIPGTWSEVSTGGNGVIASKTDGTYWSWGGSYYGHLGNNTRGPTAAISSPTQVPGDYLNIVVGANSTLFQRNA